MIRLNYKNKIIDFSKAMFLRWAGGKKKIIKHYKELLTNNMPEIGCKYIEPFVGGGAIFFHIEPESAVLADTNVRLIECYRVLRSNVMFHLLLIELSKIKYSRNFIAFNINRNRFNSDEINKSENLIERVALFIYLNHTCFHGLFRVNKKGEFNVGFEHNRGTLWPHSCISQIEAAHNYIMNRNVTLMNESFENTLLLANKGDLVFLDPPYFPLTSKSFVDYNTQKFGLEHHILLIEWCKKLNLKGCKVFYSNSMAPWIIEQFDKLNENEIIWTKIDITRTGPQGGKELMYTNTTTHSQT